MRRGTPASVARSMPSTRSASGPTSGIPASSKKRRQMSPTAPRCSRSASSSSENTLPDLARRGEGSTAPMPTRATETVGNRSRARRTEGSSLRTSLAAALATTPGTGSNAASPRTVSARVRASSVACRSASGSPTPPRICTTLRPFSVLTGFMASTVARRASLHDEMPSTMPGRSVVSRWRAAAAPRSRRSWSPSAADSTTIASLSSKAASRSASRSVCTPTGLVTVTVTMPRAFASLRRRETLAWLNPSRSATSNWLHPSS